MKIKYFIALFEKSVSEVQQASKTNIAKACGSISRLIIIPIKQHETLMRRYSFVIVISLELRGYKNLAENN